MIRIAPLILGLLLALMQCAGAQASRRMTVLVYFTGIGCPHCAKTDPVLFKQKVRKGDLLIVEYEIYRDGVNAPLLMDYYTLFDGPPGIPAVIAGSRPGQILVGDWPILQQFDGFVGRNRGNGIALRGRTSLFEELNLVELLGRPKLWFSDRVAVRTNDASRESDTIKSFLFQGRVPAGCRPLQERRIALSDDSIEFREGCTFNGWTLMHN